MQEDGLSIHPFASLRTRLGWLTATVALVALVALSAASLARANGVALHAGDVLAATGSGQVKHFNRTGSLLDTLDTGTGSTYTTGMCFDASSNLFVTDFNSDISEFNPSGNLVNGTFVSDYSGSAESCAWDSHGHMYVGAPDNAFIDEYDTSGTLLHQFPVTGGNGTGGTDNIALGSDGCTLYYDGEGTEILRFNVCTNTQLSDLVTAPQGSCYAMAVRPNGDLMVACSANAYRFNSAGTLVQTYTEPAGGSNVLFALNLDPDGTTFWTGDSESGQIYHFDINTGTLLGQFNSGAPGFLFGLAIVGQITVSLPSCTMTSGKLTTINTGTQSVHVENTVTSPSSSTEHLVLRSATGGPQYFTLTNLTSSHCGVNPTHPGLGTGTTVNTFSGQGTGKFGTSVTSNSAGYSVKFEIGDWGDNGATDITSADTVNFTVTNSHGTVVWSGKGNVTSGKEEASG